VRTALLYGVELAGLIGVLAVLQSWMKLRAILRELERIRQRWEREDGYG